MLNKFRYFLFPFSLVYGAVVGLRNKLFDKKILRSATFDFPLICIGNLSMGGTGKTPMVEYIIRILTNTFKVATLSRGYKRKTKGFIMASESTTAADIGDEPMQIHKKFPNITVCVAEERVIGIPRLLDEKPGTEVIILDDAFQHREIKAGLNILLTECNNLYSNDFLLPSGNLRDNKNSSKRADIIIVTKCDSNLTEGIKEKLIKELKPELYQEIYFTSIKYDLPQHLFTGEKIVLDYGCDVLLICGIANPRPIMKFLDTKVSSYEFLKFKDHHIFKVNDLKEIKDRFSKIKNEKKIILATEKDAVRLTKFEKELAHFPIYILPMSHYFLFDQETLFEKKIQRFISSFEKGEGFNN
ncbi:MAG TPA: tetraacyldisaccharide 4'-kinase [Hanamia sp.]|nr:tetraacyldisaccharide 4'-kinase [Hanamia sp.]